MTEGIMYPVKLYTDSMTAKAGNRLAVIRFKTPRNPPKDYKKPPTYCVELPEVEIAVEPDSLIKPLTAAFHDLQDSIIREKVEALIAGDNACNQIASSELTADAVSVYFDKVAANGRLSKESVAAWFDEYLAEDLAAALLAVKPDLASDPDNLAKAVNGHKQHICNLASPRAAFPEKLATQLLKAVNISKDGDSKTKEALRSKLQAFINPPKTEDLLATL